MKKVPFMANDYSNLFLPYTLNNGVTVPNRLAVAPLTLYCQNPDGTVSDDERDFLKHHGEGFGLYVTGATLVDAGGQSFYRQARALSEADLPSLRERVEIVRSLGAIPIAQLFHDGILANPDFLPDRQPRGPSATPDGKASELTEAEIESLIQKFAYAAELCMKAGYAGVEVHGAGPFLLPQFVSEATNRRTDRWGGSLENRLRFPLAVLDTVIDVKKKAGQKDFIIGYRITPEQPGEKGITMKETLAAVSEIVKRAIQYLHVSQQNFFHAVRRGADTSKSRMELIHEAVAGRTAVIGAGELVTGADFERAVSSGWTEFAAAGQSVMLNPDLARLVREGRDDLIDRFRDESKNDSYHLPKVLWPWVPDKDGPAKLP